MKIANTLYIAGLTGLIYFCFGLPRPSLAQHATGQNVNTAGARYVQPITHTSHHMHNLGQFGKGHETTATSITHNSGAAGMHYHHYHLNQFSVEYNSKGDLANYFGLSAVGHQVSVMSTGQVGVPAPVHIHHVAHQLNSATGPAVSSSSITTGSVQTVSGSFKHESHALAVLAQVRQQLNGADLNLGSTKTSVTWTGQTVTIQVGDTTKALTAGERITPAELQAGLEKLDGSGLQSLVIGANGAATGGTLVVTMGTMHYFDLVLPVGVTIDIKGATAANPFAVGGGAIVGGTIDFLSGTSGVADFSAKNLLVGPGGKILDTGALDFSLLSLNNAGTISAGALNFNVAGSTAVINSGSIIANSGGTSMSLSGNLNNSGSIASSGVTSISTAGSINNINTQIAGQGSSALEANLRPTSQVPIISGASVDLVSQKGSFANNGIIKASTGDVTMSSPGSAALSLDNSTGQVIAESSSINFNNPLTNASSVLSITGGDLLATGAVNINAAQGLAYVNIGNITAPLNVSASSAHVTAATANLILGKQCVTGDPTYYNTAGDVIFSSDISTNGANLAVVASQSIRDLNVSSSTDVTVDSGGGTITLIAGFAFTSSSGLSSGNPGGSAEVLTITGASTTGGGIYGLNLISHGGNIFAAANSGPAGSNFGTMQLGNIDSGATGSGVNGNITLIAGGPNAGTILISNITTIGGTGGGGNVVITTAQPTISGNGTMTIDGSGNITSGNTIIGTIPGASASVSLGNIGTTINIAGNLTFNTTSVFLFDNANIAGNLNLNPNNTTTNISYINFDNPGNGLQSVFNVGGGINVATASNLNSLNTVFFEGDSNIVNATINVTGGIGSLSNSVVWFTGFAGGVSLGNIKGGIVNFDGQGTVNISGTVQATANQLDAVHIGNAGSDLAITVNGTINSASGVSIQGSSLTVGAAGAITSSAGSNVYIASQASNVPMVVTLSGTNSSISALGGGSIIFGYAIYDGPFYPNYNPTLTQYSSAINCNSGTGQLSGSSISFNVGNSYNVTLNTGVLNGTLTGSASAINLAANNGSMTLGSIGTTNSLTVQTGNNGNITLTDNQGGSGAVINITANGSGFIEDAGAGTYTISGSSVSLTSTTGQIGTPGLRGYSNTVTINTGGPVHFTDSAAGTITLNASTGGSNFTFISLQANILVNGNVNVANNGVLFIATTSGGANGAITVNGNAIIGNSTATVSLDTSGPGNLTDTGAGTGYVQGAVVNLSSLYGSIGSPGFRVVGNSVNANAYANIHLNNVTTNPVVFTAVTGGASFFQVLSNGPITVTGPINAPTTVFLAVVSGNGGITLNGVVGTSTTTTTVSTAGSGNIVEGTGGGIDGASITVSSEGGNLGTSSTPLAISGGNLLLYAGGLMNVSNSYSGSVTLASGSAAGTSMSVSTNGPFTVDGATSGNGNLTLVTTSGAMSIANSAAIASTNGSIVLQDTDTSSGSITFGSGVTVHASATTAGVGNVDIVVGAIPSNPVEGTAPSNVVVNNTGGAKTYFGTNGITADAPTNTLNASGRNIVFNTPLSASSIKLGGGDVITADPPVPQPVMNNSIGNDQIQSSVAAELEAKSPLLLMPVNSILTQPSFSSNMNSSNTTFGITDSSIQLGNGRVIYDVDSRHRLK